jgi:hypothetical protein
MAHYFMQRNPQIDFINGLVLGGNAKVSIAGSKKTHVYIYLNMGELKSFTAIDEVRDWIGKPLDRAMCVFYPVMNEAVNRIQIEYLTDLRKLNRISWRYANSKRDKIFIERI